MNQNHILKYCFVIISCLSVLLASAKDQDEKKKVIEKSHKVNTSTVLRIENKFGKIEINSWDKSEFSIKVEMIAKARNEDRAQRILDNIDVDVNESSNTFRSQFELGTNSNRYLGKSY